VAPTGDTIVTTKGGHESSAEAGQAPETGRVLSWPFLAAIRLYQWTLSPLMGMLGAQCRFTPTCSHYAFEAYKLHGPVRGTLLTAKRLGRCHPWGGSGIDPVPGGNQATEKARNGDADDR